MSRNYDNGERLVAAVLDREKPSFDSTISEFSSCSSFGSTIEMSLQREVDYLQKLRHSNLVKFIGYCSKDYDKFMVHEFMPNGSLKKRTFARRREYYSVLAHNNEYGYRRCERPFFLARKGTSTWASNILLDDDFNAKLSDFTSAELDPLEGVKAKGITAHPRLLFNQHTAPEYITRGELTAKSDVYSFGVVLLELLCGRPVVDLKKVGIDRYLVEWAYTNLMDRRKLFEIMDTKLEGQYPQEAAFVVATLAFETQEGGEL